jgi:hypothetical protein
VPAVAELTLFAVKSFMEVNDSDRLAKPCNGLKSSTQLDEAHEKIVSLN